MRGDDRLKLARRGVQRARRAVKNSSGDAGRYCRSFGSLASLASPPCGEWKAYRVTAAIARNSIQNSSWDSKLMGLKTHGTQNSWDSKLMGLKTHGTCSIPVARSRMAPRAGF